MLRRHWVGAPVRWGARRAGPGLVPCDPLANPGGDSRGDSPGGATGHAGQTGDAGQTGQARLSQQAEGAAVLLCLAGVTPAAAARGADYDDDARLALAAMTAGAAAGAHVFLCSSAAVYGRAPGPLREEAAPSPAAPYGAAKAAMEAVALERAARTGQGVTILRIGNVAGADAILGGWREGFALDVFPGGATPARSYIGPATLARVLGALAARAARGEPLPQVLNIAAPGAVQMGALLDAAGLAWVPRPAPEGAIARVAFDTARLEALVPLDPGQAAGLVAEWRAETAA